MTMKAMRLGLAIALFSAVAWAQPRTLEGVPRYAHIFVIVDENKDFSRILGGSDAPTISRLAKTYGMATNFYGEVHPSEANYVALLAGDDGERRREERQRAAPRDVSGGAHATTFRCGAAARGVV